jgi:ribosomal protein S12 methylthiotransferase accessory factor
MPPALILKDAYKGYTGDQDKLFQPEETMRRFHDKLRSVDLDILERTVRIDNGRLNIPVFMSFCGRDSRAVIGNKKQMGKGAFPAQAEASALMELAERFSLFSFAQNSRNFRTTPFNSLTEPALPFELIARSVHDQSAELDCAARIFERIPLQWTRAFNPARQTAILVPFDWFYAINEFNGSSAGNCPEEALVQGLCEVIERHVCARISRERLPTPRIDPASIKDETARLLLHKFQQAGIRLFLNDFSLDTGLATVSALAYDPFTFPQKSEIVWTAGTATDPQKAVSRALTETAQLAGDFNTASCYVASGLPKIKTLAEAEFITRSAETIDIARLPDQSHRNFRQELENVLGVLAPKSLEPWVIDVTHAELQIPAFYTLIPGAHFRERAQNHSVALFCAKMITRNLAAAPALSELESMDKLLPGKYYIKFFQGLCRLELQNPESALICFKQALELGALAEDLAAVYAYMGQAFKDQGRFAEAVQVLEQGAQQDPERTDLYNLMGFCHYKLKDHRKAIECFRQALRLDPSSAIDYANIGVNFLELGEKEKARDHLRLALTLDPGIDFARRHLLKLESQKDLK